MSDSFRAFLRIDAAHPALPGHFPGNPVVPAVVVLERVATTLQAWRGERVEKLEAKFVRPLLPGEEAVIDLQAESTRVRFIVTRADGVALARGTLQAVHA